MPKNRLSLLFLFLFSTVITCAQDNAFQHPELMKPFINSRFLEADSVTFHYRIWNDMLPVPKGKVLFVHGFCGSTMSWRMNWDTLVQAGYRVVAVDLPGFGYSERDPDINQSQSNRARLLWDLLKEIDRGDTAGWNIVGHSMGGGTVEAMALMHPERTRSLTIVDGMVFIKNENLKGAFITTSKWKDVHHLYVNYARNYVLSDKTLKRLLKKAYGYVPDSALVEEYIRPLRIEGTAETVISIFSNADEICRLNAAGLSRVPVLLVWGEDDKTISVSQGEKLKKHVPSVGLEVIPGARHMPMETHSGIFNRLLLDFLKKNN
jgi:pimeloyl-ACP methyl ester carboxylesterase